MYINRLFPFLTNGDFIRNTTERKTLSEIYCPLNFEKDISSAYSDTALSKTCMIKAYHVFPCDVYVLNEPENVIQKIMAGAYGSSVDLNVIEIDYMPIARRIEVDLDKASIKLNGAYMQEDIVTDIFINSAANGAKTLPEFMDAIIIDAKDDGVDVRSWINSIDAREVPIQEKSLADQFLKMTQSGQKIKSEFNGVKEDFIYSWLDAYFKLPEGQDMNAGGREVVPLLIGPTGVFKSATIKELCAKYNYRLVDFRVSFTSRLDYSGLFQMGEIDGQKYSYACPMEELVTCSDGFREYCRRAYDRVTEILAKGYIETNKASNGAETESLKTPITEDQKAELQKLLDSYKEYMKTPVLFLDEITRCKDAGVEGILVQLLNQKKFNNMTMQGCKFVAATNMNLLTGDTRHDDHMNELDEMYDVNTDLDVAYSNRFMPLKVLPDDVAPRWYEWADNEKLRDGKLVKNIHPIIIEFLKSPKGRVNGQSLLYNESPVLDAIEENLTENEQKSQTFPNYRTWEMLSDYMYSIDREHEIESKNNPKAVKEYRTTIIEGLISKWASDIFVKFLASKGYVAWTDSHGEPVDDVGDFLESTLGAGVPALMIGPSSLGKTSRVNAYIKKVERTTGLKPELININLASKDTVDLMGMPSKISLIDYVGGGKLSSLGLGSVGQELKDIVQQVANNSEYGMTDTLTVRAPDKTIKDQFEKALKEGREVVLLFDECNRVKNPTIMSAMFEVLSDSRFAGVSFKHMKDKVKVIAACNMAHSQMGDKLDWGEVGDYGNAGSLDPALAARFSIYWKKNYDEKDVKSWINFMEGLVKEGQVDPIVLEFFKSLPVDQAIKLMASVEKRKLENAEASTRALLQLSKDIKSMRGQQSSNGFKSSLYNGKVIFDSNLAKELNDLTITSNNPGYDPSILAQNFHSFVSKITTDADVWEPAVTGMTTLLNGVEVSGSEIMETLQDFDRQIQDMTLRPITSSERTLIKQMVDTAISFADSAHTMDIAISNKRQRVFEAYVGQEFANSFVEYFNSTFGTENDVNITIEMLEDDKLIAPFIKKKKALFASQTVDELVDSMIAIMKEFWDVHSSRLPPKNYSTLITEICNVFPNYDNIAHMLNRSGKDVDGVYTCAEGSGDAWIMSVLKAYPGSFSQGDIDTMRAKMTQGQASSKNRRTRIL